jgi:hypothetical protein
MRLVSTPLGVPFIAGQFDESEKQAVAGGLDAAATSLRGIAAVVAQHLAHAAAPPPGGRTLLTSGDAPRLDSEEGGIANFAVVLPVPDTDALAYVVASPRTFTTCVVPWVAPSDPAEGLLGLAGHARDPQRVESFIEFLMPARDVPSPAWVLQARRNAEARQRLLDEWGGLTSEDVADHAGNTASNREALASRWRKERRILGVEHHGRIFHPGFQFDPGTGRPLKAVRRVLTALAGAGIDGWQAALWFTSPTAALDDQRPVDLLQRDPKRVIEAAERVADLVW